MKMKEFWAVLAQSKRRWYQQYGYILRGRTRSKDIDQVCPITDVCARVTGKLYDVADVKEAGKALGLRFREIGRVMLSADGAGSSWRTRRKLEKILLKK